MANISKAQQAKAEAALDVMVRVNDSAALVDRRSLVDRLVAEGYRVQVRKNGERVLMSWRGHTAAIATCA